MKKLGFMLLLSALASLVIFSCQKEKIDSFGLTSPEQTSNLLEEINNYRPGSNEIATLYYGFLDRIKAIKENNQTLLKDDPDYADTTIDVGTWQIETGLNNEYGFKNDSIVYEKQDMRYYTLDIIGYEDDIPVVPGEQLDSMYLDMEDYIEENALQDSLFWMCIVEVETIGQSTVTLSILPYQGEVRFCYSVLPVGTDPVPFPPGTAIRSCYHYQGIQPLWEQIKYKIRGGAPTVPAPGYIFVTDYAIHKSWNSNPFVPDDRFWAGTSPNQMVYTNDCNYYLTEQKSIVDDIVTGLNPNHILGTFDMYFFPSPSPVHMMTYWHYSDSYIFEVVWVGIPG